MQEDFEYMKYSCAAAHKYNSHDTLSCICHITVMKLIHAILGIGAASLLPTALAQQPASKEVRPYIITIASDVKPIAKDDLRYPYLAGSKNIEGACQVTFTISTAGEADAVRVGACTSEIFRAAAKANVERMTFAPRSTAMDNVRMNISWSFDHTANIHTASLN